MKSNLMKTNIILFLLFFPVFTAIAQTQKGIVKTRGRMVNSQCSVT